MANPFKGAMSFFGLASTEDEDRDIEEYSAEPSNPTFDDDAHEPHHNDPS